MCIPLVFTHLLSLTTRTVALTVHSRHYHFLLLSFQVLVQVVVLQRIQVWGVEDRYLGGVLAVDVERSRTRGLRGRGLRSAIGVDLYC